jgi:uncharacterized DUF497 family protein
VSFEDAATAFGAPLARIFADEYHSDDESCELLIGHTKEELLIVVSFVERDAMVRIIGARPTTPRERQDYEDWIRHA